VALSLFGVRGVWGGAGDGHKISMKTLVPEIVVEMGEFWRLMFLPNGGFVMLFGSFTESVWPSLYCIFIAFYLQSGKCKLITRRLY
jgi:hypothetical protein